MKRILMGTLLFLVLGRMAAEAQRIVLLPQFTSDRQISSWIGVSQDGMIVSGYHYFPGTDRYHPFHWSEGHGFRYLTPQGGYTQNLDEAITGSVWGMSDSGVVVGRSGSLAFRWRPGIGVQYLSPPAPATHALAIGSSWDGSVVVGSTPGAGATIWNANGNPRILIRGTAWDVTPDGRVVVGGIRGDDGLGPFIWTEETGIQRLPIDSGTAHGVSADGRVVVGNGGIFQQGRIGAFRWTQETGVIFITPPGWEFTSARDVTADGSVIVGAVGSDDSFVAYRWTEERGFELLNDVYGHILPPNISLSSVSSISPDGRFLIGRAEGPQGDFVYLLDTVPEPSSLLALGIGLGLLWKRRRRK